MENPLSAALLNHGEELFESSTRVRCADADFQQTQGTKFQALYNPRHSPTVLSVAGIGLAR